jgi:ATP-dependent Lhr-like helicase
VRWRWNAGRALVLLRQRGGKRVPPPIQRMEADDLMAAVFPALAACQENAPGPIEPPDHLLVRQTLADCLREATDADGLVTLLEAMASGAVRVHFREASEPSPLAHEILNGKPYTFLDDAPLEERRTRAVAIRRGLPDSASGLGALDPDAVERVRAEARPAPRDAEELHDVLLELVLAEPEPAWADWLAELARAGRAARTATAGAVRWLATESRALVEALFAGASFEPDVALPPALAARPPPSAEEAAVAVVRGHLSASGPATAAALSLRTALAHADVEIALARLEAEGFALRGRFTAGAEEEFCERRLLARIHRSTLDRLRREIEPVSAQDFVRFLLRWQHAAPHTQREGRRGLLAVLEQLQGFELAAGAFEERVLPARVAGYRPEWLDDLCLSGEVAWARLTPRTTAPDDDEESAPAGRGGLVPSRSTKLTFCVRSALPWLLAAARGEAHPLEPGPGAAHELLERLRSRGALFQQELAALAGRLPIEVDEGLWDLVARGLVTADGFAGVRALLGARERRPRARARTQRPLRGARAGGRWALVPEPEPERGADGEALAERVAAQLLARWGVVFRDLVARESLGLPWREILWALRRMEARGSARGGRFVTGFVGEQYALPGAVDALREVRRRERTGEVVRLSAADPLNLVGIVLPGPRVPALRTRTVAYRDGAWLEDAAPVRVQG